MIFRRGIWGLPLLLAVFAQMVFAQRPRNPRADLPNTAAGFLVQKLEESRPGTRSLRRRSQFLGALKGQSGVQLAFVLDGTDSMGDELHALKQQISAIAENLADQVEDRNFKASIAVVVYRDAKAPSGRVQLVVPAFTSDLAELEEKLDGVQAETGAPYFDELVDEGVHAALTRLNWSDRDDVTRWIILCGDAPPYPESTKHRRFTLSELVSTAREKRIAVYGLCVNSSQSQTKPELARTAQSLRPECSAFFTRLAEATGGKVRNLWDRDALLADLQQKPIEVVMPAITEADIAAARRSAQVAPLVAVLPPAVGGQVPFEKGTDAVVWGTAAQRYLSQRGLAVRGPAVLEEAFATAVDKGGSSAAAVRNLADQVSADFVLSGTLTTNAKTDETQLQFTLFGREAQANVGSKTATWSRSESAAATDRISATLADLLTEAGRTEPRLDPKAPTAGASSKPEFLAKDTRARRSILAAMYALDKSLAAETPKSEGAGDSNSGGSSTASTLLRSALADLQSAAEYEADNPVVELLLGQAYYNLLQLGEMQDESHLQFVHLQRAYELRSKPGFAGTAWESEIDGYYALLVEKDVARAVKVFEAAAAQGSGSMAQLRAHWMLAGLYFGDWDARVFAPRVVDPVKAREHVLAILVQWPHLPEADFYRQCLQGAAGEAEVKVPLMATLAPGK